MTFAATVYGAHEEAMLTELTSREQQVMRLIAKGLSNSEIGRQLDISEALSRFI